MTMPGLADLIYQGNLDQAIELAKQLNPDEIRNRIFRDDDRFLDDKAPCDVFFAAGDRLLRAPPAR